MNKTLYYDCFAGISGDMNLAAMIALGVPEKHLVEELAKLNIDEYRIETSSTLKMGISGTQVNVKVFEQDNHSHGHHHHHHHHDQHRSYKDIKKLINSSPLSTEIKATSIAIFERIAIAEGKIHSKTIDEVHFHEVGAVDSIVDIVGAAICFHYLKPDRVICSTIELGGGFVNCAHGKFPVPAPATTEIVKDIPVKLGTVKVETTTPTGAAILATLVDEFNDQPEIKIKKTAYGIGHRDMEIPNVLRVHWAETDNEIGLEYSSAKLIECNIDDMPAEHFEYILNRLMNMGAQDVFLTPIVMKKSRPATKINVLCTSDKEKELISVLLQESTTLGVRTTTVTKQMLQREYKIVPTKYGDITMKIGLYNGKAIKFKPEYDDCSKAANTHNISLSEVINEAHKNYKKG